MSEWDDMNPGKVAWGSLRTLEKQNTFNVRNNSIVVASPLLLLCQLKVCIKLEFGNFRCLIKGISILFSKICLLRTPVCLSELDWLPTCPKWLA